MTDVVPTPPAERGGPETPAGQARASTFALLPGEDPAAFAAQLEALARVWRPADAFEAALVRRLAVALWQAERAERLEAQLLQAMMP
jgi:hypothetical protein